eukprot:Phypoly_transcript_05053.p1 GENE.Phypoly_transcript_05053~~Phypoly_transcript_05053.p1  ORF type:complete len:539 (+),score=69.34 Phypoly_transcript_05053:217-1617(+)
MRLPVKSFWGVSLLYVLYLGANIYENQNMLEDVEAAVETLNTTPSIAEITYTYMLVLEQLDQGFMWEKYLRAGLVSVALRHLVEMRDRLAKNEELSGGDRNVIHSILGIITGTLARLCELEPVANSIVREGVAEVLVDLALMGYIYPPLWESLLEHDSTSALLLQRPEFMEKAFAQLYSPRSYALMSAFSTLVHLYMNDEIRPKLQQDERMKKWMEWIENDASFPTINEILEAVDDGPISDVLLFDPNKEPKPSPLHFGLYAVLKGGPEAWEDENVIQNQPEPKIFQERKDFLICTSKVVVGAALGAVYCGLRWRRALPNLQTSLIWTKTATAFLGLSVFYLADGVNYFTILGPKAKAEFTQSISRNKPYKFTPEQLLLSEVIAWAAGGIVFFVTWYNTKFILLPALLMAFLTSPSADITSIAELLGFPADEGEVDLLEVLEEFDEDDNEEPTQPTNPEQDQEPTK